LCDSRIVRDPHAANRESQSRVGGNGVGIRGGCGESDAVELSIRRNRNGRCVRESECRRVRRSVRHGRGPPVRLGIPIARAGVTLPCYAAGLAGLDAKHQDKRAENRSDVREWCFHGEPESGQRRPAMSSFYFAYLVNSCQCAPRIVEKESDQSLILYLALNQRRRNAEKCCLTVDRA